MEWVLLIVIVAMLGLYIWSHVTAGHRIGKKVQPFVDELFDAMHKPREKPKQ